MGMFRSSWFTDVFATPSYEGLGVTLPILPSDTLLSPEPVWLVYVTRSGLAQAVAEGTRNKLKRTHPRIHKINLDLLDLPLLQLMHQALFVIGTTGDGDPPDLTGAFDSHLMDRPASLQELTYGLLALSDSDYDNCHNFGRRLDGWLQESGAQAWFNRVEAADEDAGRIARWYRRMSALSGQEPEHVQTAPVE